VEKNGLIFGMFWLIFAVYLPILPQLKNTFFIQKPKCVHHPRTRRQFVPNSTFLAFSVLRYRLGKHRPHLRTQLILPSVNLSALTEKLSTNRIKNCQQS